MWNLPRKLLFFDEEDIVKSPGTDVVQTCEEKGPFREIVVSAQKETQWGGSGDSGFASNRPDSTYLQDIAPSDLEKLTLSLHETGRASVALGTSYSETCKSVFSGRQFNSQPKSSLVSSLGNQRQRLTALQSSTEADNPSVMVVTRSSDTMVTACSANRQAASGLDLQQLYTQGQQSLDKPEQFAQPGFNELNRLQLEALGARPRTSAAPVTRRRASFEDSVADDSSVQKLCSMMELQAQVSLRHSIHQTGFRHEALQTSPQPEDEQSSLRKSLCRPSVQYNKSSSSKSRLLPVPNYKRKVTEHCSFCERNGERKSFYMSHKLHAHGRVTCPILQRYICPLCGATGESAHTVSYCPFGDGSSSVAATRTQRKSCGCIRACKHGAEHHH